MENGSSEIVILNPKEAIGIFDLRSLGYYKLQQRILQHNPSKLNNFEPMENVCNHFSNLINTPKEEETTKT